MEKERGVKITSVDKQKQCNIGAVSNPLSCVGCKYHNTTDDELCGTCGDTYKNKATLLLLTGGVYD